jgi:ribA/ribD-fused uncharacterized protein
MNNLKTDTHYYFLTNFLSNFHDIPKGIIYNGLTFYTTEHMFMYRKAEFFKDTESMRLIHEAEDPYTAKRLGRNVKNYSDTEWSKVSYQIMYEVNYLKFTTDKDLTKKLSDTDGLFLVEASPVDCIWGVGLSADDPLILDSNQWNGLNFLGSVLMEVREVIKYRLINQAHNLIDELEMNIIYMFVSANSIK